MKTEYDIAILGGGISGLATAFFLKQKRPNLKIALFEKEKQAGGWIRTHFEEGALFELGARGFRGKGKGELTLRLVAELGLENALISACDQAKKRYLLLGKRLQAIPTHPLSLLFSSHFRFLIPLFFRERRVARTEKEDETIADFFRRRFSDKMLQTVIDPFISGLFAGDPETLSLNACLPQLALWEKEYGSMIKGCFKRKEGASKEKAPLYSFKRGMSTLPLTLARHLEEEGVEFRYKTCISSLIFKREKAEIRTHSETFTAKQVISALPIPALKSCYPTLEPLLNQIPLASIATLNLLYAKRPTIHQGFGYLVPSSANEKILGVTFDSDIFPAQDSNSNCRYTVMFGGSRSPELIQSGEFELLKIATSALHRHLGIATPPLLHHLHYAHLAIPQYPLYYQRLLQEIEKSLPSNFFITGNGFYGVGINDCIERALKLSEVCLDTL